MNPPPAHIIYKKNTFTGMWWYMKLKKQITFLGFIIFLDLCLAAGLVFMVKNRREEAGAAQVERVSTKDDAITQIKTVALTFDDGPSSQYTEILLDGLKAREVKASFFLIGECIEGNEAIVKRMEEEGHLVGVHCMSHKDLTKETRSAALKELADTGAMIGEITGKQPEYVRPPFGNWNEALQDGVSMEPVFWTVDSIDWKLKNASRIVKKVMKDTKDGDIILMHDEFASSVEAALRIIDNLQAEGYTFVTVDELTID